MSECALQITGGTIVTEYGTFKANLGIDDEGKISHVVSPDVRLKSRETISAQGLLVLPGAVDSHTHLGDPGLTHREDFYTGTAAAAAGGITTVLDHPQTKPIVDCLERFEEKRRTVSERAVVDFGLWGAVTPDNVSPRGSRSGELEKMVEAGACAFKGFMTFGSEMPRLHDGIIRAAFQRTAPLGVPVGIHAENGELVKYMEEEFRATGQEDPLLHTVSRSEMTEVEAVSRLVFLAKDTGARVHCVHLSVPESVDVITAARKDGYKMTAETCGHYLTLTSEILSQKGAFGKCNPPLRSARCVEGLWDRLARGEIHSMGSDHAPYHPDEKRADSFWSAPAGLTGTQLMPTLVLSECLRRGIPLELAVRILSSNNARIFGLYPKKGTIAPGSDADLFFFDPKKRWVVTGEELLHKWKWCPFEGREITGKVRLTLVRGTVVFDDERPERITVKPGHGKFVKPPRCCKG
ncbi:MAG: allantoinase AllB [Firmicutes bacterium]|nr:allantoinase AllB [Candidatus Fermentithermobacillaceae bacterium]